MGDEKDVEPGSHDKDNTHIVQAIDSMGRVASRDAYKSEAEAEARAAELKAEGHKVEVSSLEPKPKSEL